MSAAFADWSQQMGSTTNNAGLRETSAPQTLNEHNVTSSLSQNEGRYKPDFDIDNRRGMVGEAVVGTFLEAMGTATVEVKTDSAAHRTGNFYIETAQRLQAADEGLFVASGINVSKAGWWAFAGPSGTGFIAIKADVLKQLAHLGRVAEQPVHSNRTNQTKGRLVRVNDIVAEILRLP
jgi:hypothetical protein